MANTTEREDYKRFIETLKLTDEPTIAWFSGWLSADGSIKVDKKTGVPKITFTITDRDPLERFSVLFGNQIYGPIAPSGLGKKQRYSWQISGLKAKLLIQRCYPWLSARYAERADEALNYEVKAHNGRKLTPDDISCIRELLQNGRGMGRSLAKKYDVSEALISAIKRNTLLIA